MRERIEAAWARIVESVRKEEDVRTEALKSFVADVDAYWEGKDVDTHDARALRHRDFARSAVVGAECCDGEVPESVKASCLVTQAELFLEDWARCAEARAVVQNELSFATLAPRAKAEEAEELRGERDGIEDAWAEILVELKYSKSLKAERLNDFVEKLDGYWNKPKAYFGNHELYERDMAREEIAKAEEWGDEDLEAVHRGKMNMRAEISLSFAAQRVGASAKVVSELKG